MYLKKIKELKKLNLDWTMIIIFLYLYYKKYNTIKQIIKIQ